jgi:formylglycine-generating enzyme required for sulfatase activity
LFDMLGNVFEWCQDRSGRHQPMRAEPSIDEILDDAPRLLRGGSFSNPPTFARSAFRNGDAPATAYTNFGFRPARTY